MRIMWSGKSPPCPRRHDLSSKGASAEQLRILDIRSPENALFPTSVLGTENRQRRFWPRRQEALHADQSHWDRPTLLRVGVPHFLRNGHKCNFAHGVRTSYRMPDSAFSRWVPQLATSEDVLRQGLSKQRAYPARLVQFEPIHSQPPVQ